MQGKRKKVAVEMNGDSEAAALEEEAKDEFLLLDDVVTEVRMQVPAPP